MKENEKKRKLVNYREIISTVYMAVITVIICYFASRIYKTDEEIWPRERYIIVATMVICFWMVLVKLVADRKKDLRKKMLMYHFILLTPLILMAFPIDYYEFRPLYLIPMIVGTSIRFEPGTAQRYCDYHIDLYYDIYKSGGIYVSCPYYYGIWLPECCTDQ